ncbi:MAG: hypothetical protein EPN36_16885 [Rhodanobacteraceae bacterium]|nr:MAG: hypothetical protein EPN36_16885 [Rhodanobacteraceae bacterium]
MPLPNWERRFPGLLQRELDALHTRATRLEHSVSPEGYWVVDLDWPLDGSIVHLKATYPDTFPSMRPHVRLVDGKEPRPIRHLHPTEGVICLLGRSSNQWHAGLTLADVLREQLANALNDTGDQDPQGEPADFWWNTTALKDSYCLVDSGWTLGEASSGSLDLRIALGPPAPLSPASPVPLPPTVRATVMAVRDAQGQPLAVWEGPLPQVLKDARTITAPWARSSETLLPRADIGSQLHTLRDTFALEGKPQNLGNGRAVRPFILAHPIEIGVNARGLGWIMALEVGHPKAFRPSDKGRKRRPLYQYLIPVLRAGPDDLRVRAPTASRLRKKHVAIFGLGAIGAPVALELARNGCGRLHLIEHDSVEPGNTVRWPIGVSAWGRRKVLAIANFIAGEYPGTEVFPHQQMIGAINNPPDSTVLDEVLGDVALVIDATVAWGVTQWLEILCRERGIPLLQPFATPTLEGGAVVRLTSSGGCLVCLEHAWDQGEIVRPPGSLEEDDVLTQPIGCSERTFTGASYDLQEVSLQTVRLAVQTLTAAEPAFSLIQTLSLIDANGKTVPPQWREDPLPRHPKCTCQPQRIP